MCILSLEYMFLYQVCITIVLLVAGSSITWCENTVMYSKDKKHIEPPNFHNKHDISRELNQSYCEASDIFGQKKTVVYDP